MKGYRDPKSTVIQDWKWKPLRKVQEKFDLTEIPSHVEKFGEFMDETARRAAEHGLTPRDLVKAYTLTRFSIQRTARKALILRKAGLVLPSGVDDQDRVRPEGAFGHWLHTKHGQRYLDKAEAGEVDEEAIADAQQKLRTFGKVDKDLPDALRWAPKNLPGQEARVSELVRRSMKGQSDPSEWRNEMRGLRGIRSAKAGFIAAQLGRGDQPTLDARQIVEHTGQPSKAATKYTNRSGGLGATEAVERLAARQTAMNLKLPKEMAPNYQHLAHHAFWDAAEGEQTTHQDVMDAMRTAARGGRIARADGGRSESSKIPLQEHLLRAMEMAGFGRDAEKLRNRDPQQVMQALEKIHTPFSDSPESREKAKGIVGAYRVTTDPRLVKDNRYYGIQHAIAPKDVTETIKPIRGVTPKDKVTRPWQHLYSEGKGGTLIGLGGDRTRQGMLTHINGKKLAWPVRLDAGMDYMRELNPGAVWKSAPGATTKLQNKIREAAKTGPVYGAFSPMGATSGDSSVHMFETLMSQMRDSGMSATTKTAFDRSLKKGEHVPIIESKENSEGQRAKAIDIMKKWPGLANPREAAKFAAGLSGEHRALIVKHMDNKTWHERGMPHVGITRVAITEPELRETPGNTVGPRIVRFDPDRIAEETRLKHSTYRGAPPVAGTYWGDTVPLQSHHVMSDPVFERMMTPTGKVKPVIAHPFSEDAMGRGTWDKIRQLHNPVQKITPQWADEVGAAEEQHAKYGFAAGGRVRRADGGGVPDDWAKDNKVVDAEGKPLVVYRGEHGDNPDSTRFHTATPQSISFGSREAGDTYAMQPNARQRDVTAAAPRVMPVHLRITKPVIHSDDPFVDLSEIEDKLGRKEALRLAHEHASHIENTDNWRSDVNPHDKYLGVADYLKKHPAGVRKLYLDAYPVLDDPKFVRAAVAKGYDGAIHGGNGETALDTEYRIFHPRQARSTISPHVKWRADGGQVDDPLAQMPTPGMGHNQPPEAMPAPASYIKPVDEDKRRLTPLGFYSHAAEAVWKQPMMKASPQQFKATLLNKHGVKPDEFKWSGYDQAFDGRDYVTKKEVRDHFIKNLPKVDEQRYSDADYDYADDTGASGGPEYEEYSLPGGKNYRELVMHLPKKEHPELGNTRRARDYAKAVSAEAAQEKVRAAAAAREIVKRAAPDAEYEAAQKRMVQAHIAHEAARDNLNELHGRLEKMEKQDNYKSGHWKGVDNPLLHLRVSDRTGPEVAKYQWVNRTSGNGTRKFDSEDEANQHLATLPERLRPDLYLRKVKQPQKILHVEEMQSDWGQDARDRGFKEDHEKLTQQMIEAERKLNVAHQTNKSEEEKEAALVEFDRLQDAHAKLQRNGVASAPYIDKTSKWTELGLKRILHEAATGGYDRIVFTPGSEQAKRYDLSDQVKELHYSPEEKLLSFRKGDEYSYNEQDVPPDELHKHIGRELADKLTGVPAKKGPLLETPYHSLVGKEDMTVGGEGMKGFYDKIVPTALEKLAKQHDPEAKVKLFSHALPKAPQRASGEDVMNTLGIDRDAQDTYWRALTPQMREQHFAEHHRRAAEDKHHLHALDITPKMRDSIRKGQRAYAAGGRVGRAMAGSVDMGSTPYTTNVITGPSAPGQGPPDKTAHRGIDALGAMGSGGSGGSSGSGVGGSPGDEKEFLRMIAGPSGEDDITRTIAAGMLASGNYTFSGQRATKPEPAVVDPNAKPDYPVIRASGGRVCPVKAAWKQPKLKASPSEFKKILTKQGVDPDEIEQSGYDDAFKDRAFVSKREVRDHFARATGGRIEERVYQKVRKAVPVAGRYP